MVWTRSTRTFESGHFRDIFPRGLIHVKGLIFDRGLRKGRGAGRNLLICAFSYINVRFTDTWGATAAGRPACCLEMQPSNVERCKITDHELYTSQPRSIRGLVPRSAYVSLGLCNKFPYCQSLP